MIRGCRGEAWLGSVARTKCCRERSAAPCSLVVQTTAESQDWISNLWLTGTSRTNLAWNTPNNFSKFRVLSKCCTGDLRVGKGVPTSRFGRSDVQCGSPGTVRLTSIAQFFLVRNSLGFHLGGSASRIPFFREVPSVAPRFVRFQKPKQNGETLWDSKFIGTKASGGTAGSK